MAVNIIFHCSDSSFGNAALISKWHTLPSQKVIQNGKTFFGRGWNYIGYHYVILNGWLSKDIRHTFFDGHIETGRPLNEDPFIEKDEKGAHVFGHNDNSVGVCLIGKSGKFTDKQLFSCLKVICLFEKQFEDIKIWQHSDFDNNKPYCAGLDIEKLRLDYEDFRGICQSQTDDKLAEFIKM